MSNYQDLTNDMISLFPKKKSEFYKAEEDFLNYRYPIALLGTRRTGKTVVLQQMWDKYHTERSRYIKMDTKAYPEDLEELININTIKQYDLLVIDEITNVEGLDRYLGDYLDLCIDTGNRLKLIVSGTNSLLLEETSHDSACGRLSIVRFNPLLYSDCKNILGINFYDFMLGNISFYEDNDYASDLAKDIYESLSKMVHPPMTANNLDSNLLLKIIEILIESNISENNKLPNNELIFRKHLYQLEINKRIYKLVNDPPYVARVIGLLYQIDIFSEIFVRPFTLSLGYNRVYLNMSYFFKNILYKYKQIPKDVKEGLIFKCIAIGQISFILKSYRDEFDIFVFRDDNEKIEYDLVVQNHKTHCMFFIDFKRSSSKYNKYAYNLKIQSYFYNYKCFFLTIYLLGETSAKNRYQIDYFLEHMFEIPGFKFKK